MDNDILIDQARQLYVMLLAEQFRLSVESKTRLARLENLVIMARCRYQRRLNHCVLCYQYRSFDCIREAGKKTVSCQSLHWQEKNSCDMNN
jgi:hypothetical protein